MKRSMGVRAQSSSRSGGEEREPEPTERPESPLSLGGDAPSGRRGDGGPRNQWLVIGAHAVDPPRDRGDRLVGELRGLLRHVRLVGVADQCDEPARFAASLEHAGRRPDLRGPKGQDRL